MAERPGSYTGIRPLHFIWICDCSGSMSKHGKIEALNNAIRAAIPHMQATAFEIEERVEVLVRAISFADGAQWHISAPTPVAKFSWPDLRAGGSRDMGRALKMVGDALKIPPMPDHAVLPVLVLIADGQPTDDFSSGLKALREPHWANAAVRVAIAMGQDADVEKLQEFMGHRDLKPLQANNPESLAAKLKWTATYLLKVAASPASQTRRY